MSSRPLSNAQQRYVVPWLQVTWPLDWPALFGRDAPLAVEIGFGDGQFLLQQARSHPATNLIGIELSWRRLQQLARRLDGTALSHVRLVHGEAETALQHLFAPQTIGELWINFPDPWPKTRHHARRLVQTSLIGVAAEKLVAGGQLTIATDHDGYAAWIADLLQGQATLRSRFATTAVLELAGRVPTKYERRAQEANESISYFVWYKPQGFVAEIAQQGRTVVPHVVLQGAYDLERTLSACLPMTWRERQQGVEISSTLVRAYRELNAAAWLVELVVKEGKLSQQIGLTLVPRAHGQLLLKLSAIGFPRPTWGVQRAVWHATELLQQHNPHLRVIWMSLGAGEQAPKSRCPEARECELDTGPTLADKA